MELISKGFVTSYKKQVFFKILIGKLYLPQNHIQKVLHDFSVILLLFEKTDSSQKMFRKTQL